MCCVSTAIQHQWNTLHFIILFHKGVLLKFSLLLIIYYWRRGQRQHSAEPGAPPAGAGSIALPPAPPSTLPAPGLALALRSLSLAPGGPGLAAGRAGFLSTGTPGRRWRGPALLCSRSRSLGLGEVALTARGLGLYKGRLLLLQEPPLAFSLLLRFTLAFMTRLTDWRMPQEESMEKMTVPAWEWADPDLRVHPLVSGSGADSGGAPPLPTGRSRGLLGRRSPAGGRAGSLATGPARLQQCL